jgi:hypothetical protein
MARARRAGAALTLKLISRADSCAKKSEGDGIDEFDDIVGDQVSARRVRGDHHCCDRRSSQSGSGPTSNRPEAETR